MKTTRFNINNVTKVFVIALSVVLLLGLGAYSVEMVGASEKNSAEITPEKALSVALDNAGLEDTDIANVKVTLDSDDKIVHYDVEFISGDSEYEFEINKATGAVIDKSIETLDDDDKQEINNTTQEVVTPTVPSTPETSAPEVSTQQNQTTVLTLDEAKKIALKDAGVTNVTFTKAESDYDDGVAFYDIEFISGNYEFEYEINKVTGVIIDKSKEVLDEDDQIETDNTTNNTTQNSTNNLINIEKAKEIALNDAGLTSATFVKTELDYDDGVAIFEIEFKYEGVEYEYEVDAVSGTILDKDIERDDD